MRIAAGFREVAGGLAAGARDGNAATLPLRGKVKRGAGSSLPPRSGGEGPRVGGVEALHRQKISRHVIPPTPDPSPPQAGGGEFGIAGLRWPFVIRVWVGSRSRSPAPREPSTALDIMAAQIEAAGPGAPGRVGPQMCLKSGTPCGARGAVFSTSRHTLSGERILGAPPPNLPPRLTVRLHSPIVVSDGRIVREPPGEKPTGCEPFPQDPPLAPAWFRSGRPAKSKGDIILGINRRDVK